MLDLVWRGHSFPRRRLPRGEYADRSVRATRIILSRAGEVKHGCQSWQFVVIQLEYIRQLKRPFNHITRIELLPKINVENFERVCWRRCHQLLNCNARSFATLSQAAETYCVRLAGGDKSLRCYGNMVPSHIFLDGEMGKAIARQCDLRRSRRRGFVDLHTDFRQAHLMKAANDFAPVVIVPHARDDLSLRAQSMRVIGEVRWRSSQLWSSEKQVPEHFSYADNVRVHGSLFDAQLFLDFLQRHALRLRNHRLHPNEL